MTFPSYSAPVSSCIVFTYCKEHVHHKQGAFLDIIQRRFIHRCSDSTVCGKMLYRDCTIPREPERLSLRPNWLHPLHLPQASVPPPPPPSPPESKGGGQHSPAGEGGGGTLFGRLERKLALALCTVLCGIEQGGHKEMSSILAVVVGSQPMSKTLHMEPK